MAKGCLPSLSYVLEKENTSKGKAGAARPVPRAAGHVFVVVLAVQRGQSPCLRQKLFPPWHPCSAAERSEKTLLPSHVPWHTVLHPGTLRFCPVGFKPWEVLNWGKQCQKKCAELLGWILVSKAGNVVLWWWLHAVQGRDSKFLKSRTLVSLYAVFPLCDHSISSLFWPLGTRFGCVLSGFWLCTNHRHVSPEKKKRWNIYATISTGLS